MMSRGRFPLDATLLNVESSPLARCSTCNPTSPHENSTCRMSLKEASSRVLVSWSISPKHVLLQSLIIRYAPGDVSARMAASPADVDIPHRRVPARRRKPRVSAFFPPPVAH